MPGHQKLQYSIQWRGIIHIIPHISPTLNHIANWNFEHKLFKYLLMGVNDKGCLNCPEISEYPFKVSVKLLVQGEL